MAGKNRFMKRALLLFIFCCLLIGELLAQQAMPYRYYIFDDYLLNPAYVGAQNYLSFMVGHDQNFIGLNEGSPQTSIFSIHSRVGNGYFFEKNGKINKFFKKLGNVAFGLQMTQYKYGPSRETNIGLTYGYHLLLDENYKRKSPRKLVLALTPRIQRMGFSYDDLHLVYDALDESEGGFTDGALGNLEKIRSWMFTADVGALYQTVQADVGLSAINLLQTKNRLESDDLVLNDSITLATYDSLYSQRFMFNVRLKFIELYSSKQMDIEFIPTLSALYAPKTNASEFYADLRVESIFKKYIAGVRSEILFKGQIGLNVQHFRNYSATTFLKPYIAFDFKNYEIAYIHHIYLDNDLVNSGASWGGSQISFLIKIGNDRLIRKVSNKTNWKN